MGANVIAELTLVASRLSGKVIQNINSTYVGGGVAEILTRMIPLLQQLGVDARWDVIKGNEPFFNVTKKFHNAIHGRQESIGPEDFAVFEEVSRKNIAEMELKGDVVYVHDPQPVMLIEKKKESDRKWIWRCHIDVSSPDRNVWEFLHRYVVQYDASVFSAPAFSQQLPIRQLLISPSIDPLSDKNRDLPPSVIESVLAKYGIKSDKPSVVQVSRFDYLKDPVGVIEAFEMVKRSKDCQLILAGGWATDDPESSMVLAEVKKRAEGKPDIHVLEIAPGSDLEINALQRAATVVVQKSIREGFGLTVSEALWKAKPVVASAVGGIPLQVKHRYTGLLSHGIEGTAFAIRQLLSNPDYAAQLGRNGKEHVRQNFLITRHLKDYVILFLSLFHNEEVLYL